MKTKRTTRWVTSNDKWYIFEVDAVNQEEAKEKFNLEPQAWSDLIRFSNGILVADRIVSFPSNKYYFRFLIQAQSRQAVITELSRAGFFDKDLLSSTGVTNILNITKAEVDVGDFDTNPIGSLLKYKKNTLYQELKLHTARMISTYNRKVREAKNNLIALEEKEKKLKASLEAKQKFDERLEKHGAEEALQMTVTEKVEEVGMSDKSLFGVIDCINHYLKKYSVEKLTLDNDIHAIHKTHPMLFSFLSNRLYLNSLSPSNTYCVGLFPSIPDITQYLFLRDAICVRELPLSPQVTMVIFGTKTGDYIDQQDSFIKFVAKLNESAAFYNLPHHNSMMIIEKNLVMGVLSEEKEKYEHVSNKNSIEVLNYKLFRTMLAMDGLYLNIDDSQSQNEKIEMENKTEQSFANKVLTTVKEDAQDAAWRTGGRQFVKLAQEPLVALLQRHLSPDDVGMRAKIAMFLQTDLGKAVVGSVLSIGLAAVPGDEKLTAITQRLSKEVRTESMSLLGDLVAEVVMGPLRSVIALYLQDAEGLIQQALPKELLEANSASSNVVEMPVKEVAKNGR